MRYRPLLATCALVVSACGGGGGSNSPPPPPPPPSSFTIGGAVTGLTGTVVLQNNGGNNASLTANGAFTFSAPVVSGAGYAVTILTQPANQTCALASASGTANANVTNVAVTCATNVVTVGGTIAGIRGSLVLQNNAGSDLTLTTDGNFSFDVSPGSGYDVTVLSQSTTLIACVVTNGSGVAAIAVTNVAVACTNRAPTLTVTAQSVKQLHADWTFTGGTPAGVTRFELREDPDGATGFTNVANNIGAGAMQYDHIVPLHLRVLARYILSACDAAVCVDSNTATIAPSLNPAVGYLKASVNTAGARFGLGLSVSADGSTLAVGAPDERSSALGIDGDESDTSANGSGAVYIYTRNGSTWMKQAYIKATNTAAFDQFGINVALSANGNTLVVGAPGEDSNATGVGGDQSNDLAGGSGAAYVYERSGSTWTPSAYLKATNTETNDDFGGSVAISNDGNTIAVGSSDEDGDANTVLNAGAAYVYARNGATWTPPASIIRASNAGMGDAFGRVALSGDGATLLVGAFGEQSCATGVNGDQSSNTCNDAGAAYVFTRNAGNWSQQAFLKATNTGAGDFFGLRLAISADGDTVAIGAHSEDSSATGVNGDGANNALSGSGAVYLFRRSAGVWASPEYIKASRALPGGAFGAALSLSQDGNILAVGASSDSTAGRGIFVDAHLSTGTALQSGAIYVLEHVAGVWRYRSYIKATNSDATDFFGATVSMSMDGGTLVVGAQGEDSIATALQDDQTSNASSDSGAVYIH